MPVETILLLHQGHFKEWPNCYCDFTPRMRGQVQLIGWKWCLLRIYTRVRGQPWRYCALICDECEQIVGYEAPGVGCETLSKYLVSAQD